MSEQCDALLEVLRHPNGGRFIQHGLLTTIMFAQMTNLYFSEPEERRGLREIVAWLGR